MRIVIERILVSGSSWISWKHSREASRYQINPMWDVYPRYGSREIVCTQSWKISSATILDFAPSVSAKAVSDTAMNWNISSHSGKAVLRATQTGNGSAETITRSKQHARLQCDV